LLFRAREFGIKNGMFLGTARKLCKNLVVVPYQFEQYELVSTQMYGILLKYTKRIQAVSCDEVLFQLPKKYENVIEQTLQQIRTQIFERTGK
jgi:DNA repair protein REV1